MEKVSFRVPRSQLNSVDEQVEQGDYASRSEWVREAIREQLGGNDGGR